MKKVKNVCSFCRKTKSLFAVSGISRSEDERDGQVKVYDAGIEMDFDEPFICDDCLSAKFSQCKSCDTYFCDAEFNHLLKQCGEPFVDRCIFCSTMDFIRSSANLKELRDILNLISELDIDDGNFDFGSLPIFSVRTENPKKTSEVFSWDDDGYLFVGSEWRIGKRCRMCGEADFHCDCSNTL